MAEKEDFELGDELLNVEVRRPVGILVSVRVTRTQLNELQDIADAQHQLVSEVAREAMIEYLRRRRPHQAATGA